nr:unnamed protein product [Haemonchus contortus]
MAARDPDDDTKYLSEMILNRHTVLNRVQEDLKAIHEVFQQQVSVAAMIQFQWNYIKSEESYMLGTPASKIRTISRQMKDLMQAKEKISRMGVRFVYTSRYYKEVAHLGERHVNGSVEEWDREAESMLLQLDKNKKRFEEVISEMESELEKAEKDFNEGPCHTNAEHINKLFRKAFENLTASDKDDAEKRFADVQKKIQEQSEEISRIKKMLDVPKKAVDPGNGNDPKIDDAYFSQMVKEVQANEAKQNQEPPARVHDDGDAEEDWEMRSEISEENKSEELERRLESDRVVEIRRPEQRPSSSLGQYEQRRDELNKLAAELKHKIYWMEKDLQDFPYRKREIYSPNMKRDLACAFCEVEGEHFSDSCPRFTNGNRRWNMILEKGFCQYCLAQCGKWEDCGAKKKKCYYCGRVSGTYFEYLIPREGHHTALCNIPDAKEEVLYELDDNKGDLEELEEEIKFMDQEIKKYRRH